MLEIKVLRFMHGLSLPSATARICNIILSNVSARPKMFSDLNEKSYIILNKMNLGMCLYSSVLRINSE